MPTLPERLKTAMAAREMSQNELERKIGVSKGYLSKFFNGERDDLGHQKLIGLAEALRASLDWLVFGRGSMDFEEAHRTSWRESAALEDAIARCPFTAPEVRNQARLLFGQTGVDRSIEDWTRYLEDLHHAWRAAAERQHAAEERRELADARARLIELEGTSASGKSAVPLLPSRRKTKAS